MKKSLSCPIQKRPPWFISWRVMTVLISELFIVFWMSQPLSMTRQDEMDAESSVLIPAAPVFNKAPPASHDVLLTEASSPITFAPSSASESTLGVNGTPELSAETSDPVLDDCWTPSCIQAQAQGLARAYPKRPKSEWCLSHSSSDNNETWPFLYWRSSSSWDGLILVKIPKSASSTAAGITLRIAHRHHCHQVQFRHRFGYEYADLAAHTTLPTSSDDDHQHHQPPHSNTPRPPKFLWTTVRDPATRAVSTIYFHTISRIIHRTREEQQLQEQDLMNNTTNFSLNQSTNATSTTDDDPWPPLLLTHLQRDQHVHRGALSQQDGYGFQVQYAALRKLYNDTMKHNLKEPREPDAAPLVLTHDRVLEVQQVVAEIMQSYDFVLVAERMEESLVALALLTGLSVGDVLVTASKVAGQQFHQLFSRGRPFCIPTVPAPSMKKLPAAIQDYLQSDTWRSTNYGDYLFHAAASASLDLTIQHTIGVETFQVALKEMKRLRALEKKTCASTVRFPCSDQGVPQPSECYLEKFDFGCGYKCIDQMLLDDLKREKNSQTLSTG